MHGLSRIIDLPNEYVRFIEQNKRQKQTWGLSKAPLAESATAFGCRCCASVKLALRWFPTSRRKLISNSHRFVSFSHLKTALKTFPSSSDGAVLVMWRDGTFKWSNPQSSGLRRRLPVIRAGLLWQRFQHLTHPLLDYFNNEEHPEPSSDPSLRDLRVIDVIRGRRTWSAVRDECPE